MGGAVRHLVCWIVLGVACGPPTDRDDGPEVLPRRALVIGVDGMRPDALQAANAPVLHGWFADARSSWSASTQLTAPTVSGPGWASILTGVEADRHGVASNDASDLTRHTLPTFLALAHGAGLGTAIAVQWEGAGLLVESDATDARRFGDGAAVSAAITDLAADPAHQVIFAHFDDVDHAGHSHGFSPEVPEYVAAIEGVDARLVDVAAAIAADADHAWLVLVVTDHGGEGTSHGALTPACRVIPFAVRVPGAGSSDLGAGVSHLDTAPTVLTWMGVAAAGLDGVSRLP